MDFLKRVDPELQAILSLFPTTGRKLPDDLKTIRQSPIPPSPLPDSVREVSRMIPGADGQEMLTKIYEPTNRDASPLPVVLWIHGGGYVMGHPNMDDSVAGLLVPEGNCVVVSVDYRLAPEHPYPAALEDCYAALTWMVKHANELGIDTSRLAVAGGSAGGGLTAALTLLVRDRGGPKICFQMPLYPMIDDRNETSSSHEITDDKAVWNRTSNVAAWRLYLGEYADGEISPYAAPARALNYEGLPKTYTIVGQLDPFRDETITYVTRLAQAGVDVEFHLYPGCFHGFEGIVPNAEISRRARNGYVTALAKALNP